jgi:hypothetical protein
VRGLSNAYRILIRKPGEDKPLEIPRRRWKDNIKINLEGIGWKGVDSIYLDGHGVSLECFVNTTPTVETHRLQSEEGGTCGYHCHCSSKNVESRDVPAAA